MAAEAPIVSEVSGVSKPEIEEKRGLDDCGREDPPRLGGGECIAVVDADHESEGGEGVVRLNGNGNCKKNGECSDLTAEGVVALEDALGSDDLQDRCAPVVFENGDAVRLGGDNGSVHCLSNGVHLDEEDSSSSEKANGDLARDDQLGTDNGKDGQLTRTDISIVGEVKHLASNGHLTGDSGSGSEPVDANDTRIVEVSVNLPSNGDVSGDPELCNGNSVVHSSGEHTAVIEVAVHLPENGHFAQDGELGAVSGRSSQSSEEEIDIVEVSEDLPENGDFAQNGKLEAKNGENNQPSGEVIGNVKVSKGLPANGDLDQNGELDPKNGEDNQSSQEVIRTVEVSKVLPVNGDLLQNWELEAKNGENSPSSGEVIGIPNGSNLASESLKSSELDEDGVSRNGASEEENGTKCAESVPLERHIEVEAFNQNQLEFSPRCDMLEVAVGKVAMQHSSLDSTGEVENIEKSQITSADALKSGLQHSSLVQEKHEEEGKSGLSVVTDNDKEDQSMASKDILVCGDQEDCKTKNIEVSLSHETSVSANGGIHMVEEALMMVDKDVQVDSNFENRIEESANTILAGPPKDIMMDLALSPKTITNIDSEPNGFSDPNSVDNNDSLPTHHIEDFDSDTVITNGPIDGIDIPGVDASSENATISSDAENLAVHSGEDLCIGCNRGEELEVENNGLSDTDDHLVYEADTGDTENGGPVSLVTGTVAGQSLSTTSGTTVMPRIVFGSMVCDGNMLAFPVGGANVEFRFSNNKANHSSVQPADRGANLKPELEVQHASSVKSLDMRDNDDATVTETKVETALVENIKTTSNSVPVGFEVEDSEDRCVTVDCDDKQMCESEEIEQMHRDEASTSSPWSSSTDALDGQNSHAKKPFRYMIKIPRFDDESVREKIKHAHQEVDEKTKVRDAFRADMQETRAACQELHDQYEALLSEQRAELDLLQSKRKEISALQSELNKVKNAISIGDIGIEISNMEHRIEHESLSLSEEKKYIREIKRLKNLRDELSSCTGNQDELKQALDQRVQIEERLKVVRQESDSISKRVFQAETATKRSRNNYLDEKEKLTKLQSQFKAADVTRQAAYADLQNLKRELFEKNKPFRAYREDADAAKKFMVANNTEELHNLCVNQVERVMDIWNNNDEFRKEYISCNSRSTLRRLKTLDGRGPDEESPVLANAGSERLESPVLANAGSERVDSLPTGPASGSFGPSVSGTLKGTSVVRGAAGISNLKSPAGVESINEAARAKTSAKQAPVANRQTIISSAMNHVTAEPGEDPEKPEEETELTGKAEELRKEEAEAELKERIRLEEKAKAMEAQERKRRNAEKARAKAELKAQREAEQKEKEREKRAAKKERKKAAAKGEAAGGAGGGDHAAAPAIPVENVHAVIREKPTTVIKRPQKPMKFTKVKFVPPIPRNKGKYKFRTLFCWFSAAALATGILYLCFSNRPSIGF